MYEQKRVNNQKPKKRRRRAATIITIGKAIFFALKISPTQQRVIFGGVPKGWFCGSPRKPSVRRSFRRKTVPRFLRFGPGYRT